MVCSRKFLDEDGVFRRGDYSSNRYYRAVGIYVKKMTSVDSLSFPLGGFPLARSRWAQRSLHLQTVGCQKTIYSTPLVGTANDKGPASRLDLRATPSSSF